MPNARQSDFFVIGITGPTGSGKSLVSHLLQAEGYSTIDADHVARQVTDHDAAALEDLTREFGSEILTEQGSLNRRKLGDIAFANKQNTQRLNDTIFPHIRGSIREIFEKHRENGEKIVFLDAPTLFESGIDKECYAVIAVIADSNLRKSRLLQRELDLTEEQIATRITAQPSDAFYLSQSDYVIWNNGDLEELEHEVKQVLSNIVADTSEKR